MSRSFSALSGMLGQTSVTLSGDPATKCGGESGDEGQYVHELPPCQNTCTWRRCTVGQLLWSSNMFVDS